MLKRIIFAILTFYSCSLFASQPSINICLTGKLAESLPVYKTFISNAANLAWEENGQNQHIHIAYYFFDNKPLSAIRAYDQMIGNHCSAIIGYEYLSDLLLVSKINNKSEIPIFTSYASSLSHESISNNIFMFMPYYDTTSNIMIKFLKKRFGKLDKILIITEIDRPDLARYKISYEKILRENNSTFDSFDYLQNDATFEKNLISFSKNKAYRFVFVLTGAVGATKALNIMNNHKTIFVGTENFGSSSNQSVFPRLHDKLIRAFTIRNIDFLAKTPAMQALEQRYQNRFGVNAGPLSIYTYDAMNIIIRSFKKFGGVDSNSVLRLNINGITGARIHNGRFYRSNQTALLSMGKNGFELCDKK